MGPETGENEVACQSNRGGVITSGGGFSTQFERPEWQKQAIGDYFDALQDTSKEAPSG